MSSPRAELIKKYEDMCKGLLDEINDLQQSPALQEKWRVDTNKDFGITTYTLTEDKALGRVGTNGTFVIKKFLNDDSYDFVRTDDFIVRGELIINAAKRLLFNLTEDNHVARMDAARWMESQRETFINDIWFKCTLDKSALRHHDEAHFEGKYDEAVKILRQLIVNMADCLATVSGNSKDEMINQLEQSEKDFIYEHGRPNIMKISNIGEGNRKETMLSMQVTHGDKTIPSTLREGNRDVLMSNHVLDMSGVIRTGRVKIKSMVDGHSSPTPIQEKDDLKRLYIGKRAFEEKLEDLALEIQKMNPQSGLHPDFPSNYP